MLIQVIDSSQANLSKKGPGINRIIFVCMTKYVLYIPWQKLLIRSCRILQGSDLINNMQEFCQNLARIETVSYHISQFVVACFLRDYITARQNVFSSSEYFSLLIITNKRSLIMCRRLARYKNKAKRQSERQLTKPNTRVVTSWLKILNTKIMVIHNILTDIKPLVTFSLGSTCLTPAIT